MRYLSLFSGIGGFEVAIQQVHGTKAICVGYSEIDKHAISEYERHYPGHKNLGDVSLIRKKDIIALGPIDLIVGGFPCNDLSSIKYTNRQGLDGDKSGLFWTMIKIIKWAKIINPNVQNIVENNASMAHKWRDMITTELTKVFKKPVYCNYFDSSQWVMQRRRRYYWTLHKIPEYIKNRTQTMKDILAPIREAKLNALSETSINYINASPPHLKGSKGTMIVRLDDGGYTTETVPYVTRLWSSRGSSTQNDYVRCIDTSSESAFLLDYRLHKGKSNFIPRYFTKSETNLLFGYPENYIETDYKSVYSKLYGMTVVPAVIVHILKHL